MKFQDNGGFTLSSSTADNSAGKDNFVLSCRVMNIKINEQITTKL